MLIKVNLYTHSSINLRNIYNLEDKEKCIDINVFYDKEKDRSLFYHSFHLKDNHYFQSIVFIVNTSHAGQGQLKVELIQPLNLKIPCRCHIQELKSHEYLIQYIPSEPGRYQLRILFNNQLVQGKTFDTDVYPSLPQVSKPTMPSSMAHIQQILPNTLPEVGDDICLQSKNLIDFLIRLKIFLFNFIVNTENPSISSIQSQILYNGMSVPHKIERAKDLHIWHLKFRPYVAGTYKIHLAHNGLSLISKNKKKNIIFEFFF